MKRNIFMTMILSLVFLCGCSAEKTEEVKTYIVPESYFTYTGTDPAEDVEFMNGKGAEYSMSAKVSEGNLVLELTDSQRDAFVQRNNEFIDQLANSLLSTSEYYKFVKDENYKKVDFYFDELASPMAQVQAVFGAASGYRLNQILINNTTDWHVEVNIYNCHTGKAVMSVVIPEGEASYGQEEWINSYK